MRNALAATLDIIAVFLGLISGLSWLLSTMKSPLIILDMHNHNAALLAVSASTLVALSNLI
ncbi:hypothetical protein [Yersinia intermedia]|uniref:hypothetical protein n=2 Tax=Yersiniaceae TaxID=1903411 RepID=UPI00124A43EE|nr:hypothetical protein [Yersinia intermedia]MCW8112960.1 hypothetical protein [Yersinia intermedia]MDA5517871.1 hypothetical protein [Yersinia intermedia]